jgi:hypothetical protein
MLMVLAGMTAEQANVVLGSAGGTVPTAPITPTVPETEQDSKSLEPIGETLIEEQVIEE